MSNPACKTYLPMLSPFIDGELPPADRQNVERHLSACKDCTMRVADLRAESGLVRLGMEMLADEADFTGFSQKVMARITPERPPLMERMRLALAEMFQHQRGGMITALAGVAVVTLIGVLVLRDSTPVGYASDQVVVQDVKAGDGVQVKPVVSESGNTIIWLVNEADDEKKKKRGGGGEEAEEEFGGRPGAPLNRGDADSTPPTGGEL